MKQKLKDLLKKKNKPTFDEAAAYFTAMTDAQKAAKKGGVTDEVLPIGLESPNFGGNAGVMNTSGFEPKLTRTKRGDDDLNGGWLPEVTVTATRINKGGYDPFGYNPFGSPSNSFFNYYNSASQSASRVDVTIANNLKKNQRTANGCRSGKMETAANIFQY